MLTPLSRDEPGEYQRYDWPSDSLAEWHSVPVGGIVFIEGNYSTRAELIGFYDYTVWIDAHVICVWSGVYAVVANTRATVG